VSDCRDATNERRLAVVHDYAGLMDALRSRVRELNTTLAAVDELAGLQGNYTSKLLAPVPIRAIGPVSLGPLLQSLGLALVVVEDLKALKRVEARLTKRRRPARNASDDRHSVLTTKKPRKRPRFPNGPEFASFMNARRTLKLDPSQRSAIARKAAQARWARVKAAGNLG